VKTPRDRTVAVLGAVAGLLALGLLVVFAVVLPKVSADPASEGGSLGEIDLPDELTGGYTALDTVESEQIPADQIQALVASQEYADDVLADLVDAGGASRQYLNSEETAAPTIQVYGAETGPLVPEQIVDPEAFGLREAPFEVVQGGEVSCIVERSEIDPATQQPLPEPRVVSVTCQRTGPGLTVRLIAGTDLGESADLVNEVWELNA
jgi:hypothetical protein